MILSFSVPYMRPMIEAGLRQRSGQDVGAERVKRQTIRRIGPRNAELLAWAEKAGNTIPYTLQLWWKSRTPERCHIGDANVRSGAIKVYRVEILHSFVEWPNGATQQCIRMLAPCGLRQDTEITAFWSPGDDPDVRSGLPREAHLDGFDSPEAFRDYFVPNVGDRFDGAMFKW